jgi:hypothetical protein
MTRLLVACPIILVIVLAMWATSLNTPTTSQTDDTPERVTARGIAANTVNQFITTPAVPQPASLIGLTQETHTPTSLSGRMIDMVDYQYTIQAGGLLYTVGYTLHVDGASITGIGTPSLTPATYEWEQSRAGDWPGWETQSAPNPVTAAIEAWAAAYTSGLPERLHQAIHDSDQTRFYVPLTGATMGEPKIRGAATQTDDKTITSLIVAVDLPVTWSKGGKPDQVLGFDLLVEGVDTASPNVVAWGPQGSGPTLTPWMNSVNVAIQVEEPDTQPTTSAPPSGTSSLSPTSEPS